MNFQSTKNEAKTDQTRVARLWEDTIIIALRDAQWLRCQEYVASDENPDAFYQPMPFIPHGMIKLDGRAESHIGDLALRASERFFVIEVKSTKQQVRDEWIKGGTFSPKAVYRRLQELVEGCNQKSPPLDLEDPMDRWLMFSLNGHFIAYWDPVSKAGGGISAGSVRLVPYLQAVVDSRMPADERDSRMIDRLPISDVDAISWPNDGEPATSRHLGRSDCCLSYTEADGTFVLNPEPIGLTLDDFQDYVDYLCCAGLGTDDGEPIHAVVLSSHGSFFQVVSSTSELALILTGQLGFKKAENSAPESEREQEPMFDSEPEQDNEEDHQLRPY